MRRPFFSLLWIVALAFGIVHPAHAQRAQQSNSLLQVNNPRVTYEFGSYIRFQAQLILSAPVVEAYLIFRADAESTSRVLPIQPDGQGNFNYQYELSQGQVRPFATVHYQYRVKLQSGQDQTSQELSFRYEDNRFTWQTLPDDKVTVHWVQGDLAFGQNALDSARSGLNRADELLQTSTSLPLDIYIYASSAGQSTALELGAVPLVGGHANPDLRLGLVSIAPSPEQKLEMDQKIPHEIGHIVTYDLLGAGYAHLPAWLSEGIATQVELTANPDYAVALQGASRQGSLISLQDLCGAFPQDSEHILLAYAESQSFTRYLIDQIGQSGLRSLLSAYGNGLSCKDGFQQVVGKPFEQLENDWRTNVLGENQLLLALYKLFPYIAILFILLAVMLISVLPLKRSRK